MHTSQREGEGEKDGKGGIRKLERAPLFVHRATRTAEQIRPGPAGPAPSE